MTAVTAATTATAATAMTTATSVTSVTSETAETRVTETTDTAPPRRPAGALGVSVVVRSVGRATLDAALASIATQRYGALEVIVVDALGSGHAVLPPSCGEHALRTVSHARSLRRPEAANAGLDAARGDAVIFLDDDDIFLPGHVARLAAALHADGGAVAAYTDVEYGAYDDAGWQPRHVFAADFDALRLRFENYLPLNAVLVRRSAASGCRFDETLDLYEDWDWWLQLAERGRFVRVPGVSARYVAAADGGSGVFSDTAPAARDARRRVLLKWLARADAATQLALLDALQRWYRDARAQAEQRALAETTAVALRETLAAREREIVEGAAHTAALNERLAARGREIADLGVLAADLSGIVAAREREIADAAAQLADLQRVLAARDDEIAHLKPQLAALHDEKPLQALARTLRRPKSP